MSRISDPEGDDTERALGSLYKDSEGNFYSAEAEQAYLQQQHGLALGCGCCARNPAAH
jgi:hypothetical protein